MKVVIVGAGPRGLSVCERLIADHRSGQLAIHLIDPYGPGGRIWSRGAAPGYLMNVISSLVTLYTDSSVVMEGVTAAGPTLYEWSQTRAEAFLETVEAEVAYRQEIAELGPNDYSSRRLFGYYQQWFYQQLLKDLPESVSLELYEELVVGFEEPDLLICNKGMYSFDQLVLATGHYPNFPRGEEEQLAEYADDHDLFYQTLEDAAFVETHSIGKGDIVLLKGVGLSFFDYIETFAKGRGGRFKEQDGELIYQPSGNEPKVYAGSGTGFPYWPRGENQRKVGQVSPSFFLREEQLASYRKAGEAPGFFSLLRKEVALAYYRSYAEELGEQQLQEALTTIFLQRGEMEMLEEFPLLQQKPWDWELLTGPKALFSATNKGYQTYLQNQISEASKGNIAGPIAAALETLKDHGQVIQDFLQAGLFDKKQYQEELLGFIGDVYAYGTSGPPLQRTRQLLALIKAGVFELLPPELRVQRKQGFFVTKDLENQPIFATALIEARIPMHDFQHTLNPLLQDLQEQGLLKRYQGKGIETEAISVVADTHRLINAKGEPLENIYCLGIPLEGQDWLTTQIPVAQRNSHFLRQTDTVAMEILWDATD